MVVALEEWELVVRLTCWEREPLGDRNLDGYASNGPDRGVGRDEEEGLRTARP